jgi:XTP/dITP diphosphohydrolase
MEGRSNRSARFVTVLTLHHQGRFEQFEGEVLGEITLKPRGGQGFGYDPVFQADGQRRTFAEMSLVEKNQLAHRARALEKFESFVFQSRIFQDK